MRLTPTIQQYAAYQAAWDYFNRVLFDEQLSPCLLAFRGRNNRCYGHFWPDKWVDDNGGNMHEIALNPELLYEPIEEVYGTLVHEMVHQWQHDCDKPPRKGYHDRVWAGMMMTVGLIPSQTGLPGGKQTGQQMTHYIDPDGKFLAAVKNMPASIKLPWIARSSIQFGKPVKPRNKVKYVCECKHNVWGKSGLSFWCDDCGQEFQEVTE